MTKPIIIMKSTNKDVFQTLCNAIDKVESGTMGVDEGKSIAHLAKQANNSLRYEIDRATLLFKLGSEKKEHLFREIEK